MQQITWYHDEQRHRWEGQSEDFLVSIQMNNDVEAHVVFLAEVESTSDARPMKLAPQAFESLEAAQEWCQRQVNRGEIVEREIQRTLGTL